MDCLNVAFGIVVDGMDAILSINNLDLFNEKPLKRVTIQQAAVYQI